MDEQKSVENQQSPPLVSVVMSVYNGEAWLKKAIDSICAQTYTHWEFLIVDDGSNTATQEILQSYAGEKRIRIISNAERRGLTKNLNTAIAQSRGSLVARMDADDMALPQRLEKQVAYLQAHPQVALVASFVMFMDEEDRLTGPWAEDREADDFEKIKHLLPVRNCLAHPTVMFRKTAWEQIPYNEAQVHSQDWDLWMQWAAAGLRMEKIKEVLLHYRVHTRSVTSTSNKKSAFLKKDTVYRNYLQLARSRPGDKVFFRRVKKAYQVNRIKLLLSGIKRRLGLQL